LQPSPLSAPPAPYYLQNRNKSKQTNGSPKMEMAEAVFFSKNKIMVKAILKFLWLVSLI
jgi:hypothetical protein